MNLFETVKGNITARQAAERYGTKVGRGGMCICPFHDDHNPSMKIDDKRFHCFGCQADGDVINFTARLYQLSPKDAAVKLANDFGIPVDTKLKYEPKPISPAFIERQIYEQQLSDCYGALVKYYHRLQNWKDTLAPKNMDDEWDPRFVEAITNLNSVDYALDVLLSGSEEEKRMVLQEYQEKGIPIDMEKMNQTPIYYQNAAYAHEHEELDQYRASHRESIACRKNIEDAIARNFDGMHLNHDVMSEVLTRHDPERVQLVLASTVQDKSWDGRFSGSNKEWAASVRLPDKAQDPNFDHRYEYSVTSHPAVLDGFINMFRKEMKERDKASVIDSLHQSTAKPDKNITTKAKEACL